MSLVFSIEEHDWATTEDPIDTLLDISDAAIGAIEAADPRFSILKSFTYYAGWPYGSQADEIKKLRQIIVDWWNDPDNPPVDAARVAAEERGEG